MDMPLQHAHPEVLRAMLRPGNGERYLEIIDDFRARVPGITMRSTFIVGFPGETDEHVDYSEEWIGARRARSRRLLRVQRGGRHAGGGARRAASARATPQAAHSSARSAAARIGTRARARIGTNVRVLVEERRALRAADPLRTELGEAGAWFGRSQGEAPGVDGGIYFTGDARAGRVRRRHARTGTDRSISSAARPCGNLRPLGKHFAAPDERSSEAPHPLGAASR